MKATPRRISEHRGRVERLLSARFGDRRREFLPAILAKRALGLEVTVAFERPDAMPALASHGRRRH
jgi:hypothetical protein